MKKTKLSSKRLNYFFFFSTTPFQLIHLASAEERFNTSFIHGAEDATQLSKLESMDYILPGRYFFDIYLNGNRIDQRNIELKRLTKGTSIVPCLTESDYRGYGIALPSKTATTSCYDLKGNISGVNVNYDATAQRLDLDVPQTDLVVQPQGTISPKLYDPGINAGFINYNFSSSHNNYSNKNSNSSTDYYFTSLYSGINFGAWRLRNNSTLSKQTGVATQWNNIASWVTTDITPLRSSLIVGQSNTNGNVFDRFSFRGIQLSSSDQMLANNQRGYAPIVRGVALSSARIEIRQNGYVIYNTNVPPGPFALRDIYPSSLSGSLQVTMIESEGRKKYFTVPFSSVPNMVREGIFNYQVTAGKYKDGYINYEPNFILGTLSLGINDDTTPYGGLLISDDYRSTVVGFGHNLGNLGAFSFDFSYSDTNLASGENRKGQSYRFLYSKSLNQLGTEFKIAGYRYSTAGYYDFSDAVEERNNWHENIYSRDYWDITSESNNIPDWAKEHSHSYYSDTYHNKRQRIELSIDQTLGDSSSLYINLNNQTYWGTSDREHTLQIGFNHIYNDISYGVFFQESSSNYSYADRNLNLTMSIPFNLDKHSVTASFSTTHSRQYGNSYNTGISGSLLEDNRFNYTVQNGRDQQNGETSTVNVSYQGSVSDVNAGYSYSPSNQQANFGASGGVVLHSGGVTLSQPLQDTFVLVQAKKAKGIRLENQSGLAINQFGYTVMPSAIPYRHNRVALRTEDIGQGLDIPQAVNDVVPTSGAIVLVKFSTYRGINLLIHSKMTDTSVPPIGASIFDIKGKNRGTVGTMGDMYVSGVNEGDRLQVRWGAEGINSCYLTIPKIPNETSLKEVAYKELSLICL